MSSDSNVRLELWGSDALGSATVGVIYPFGAMEQHGRHLPLGTDSIIVEAIARQTAAQFESVVVHPCLPIGCSAHHLGMRGTHTIRAVTLIGLVADLVSSARASGFKWALFLNGHGGNRGLIETAATEAVADAPSPLVACVNYWDAVRGDPLESVRQGAIGSMGHACELETSILLALNEELVGSVSPDDDFVHPDALLRADILQSAVVKLAGRWSQLEAGNGVRGRPSFASRETGEVLLARIVDGLTGIVKELQSGEWDVSHPSGRATIESDQIATRDGRGQVH